MRKLNADEIECRVAQVSAKGCTLLLYKTARVDRAILDEMYTACGWQNDFKVIDGKMYGGIGVRITDDEGHFQWVWKWDCGTESNTEAEKGQASDCFKRAGFKWGIGVELYTAPFIFVNCETVQVGNGKYGLKDKYVKYEVAEIGYSDKGEINKLIIKDNNGNKVYELGKKIIKKKEEPKNPDLNHYEVIESLDNIDDIKQYYADTKSLVENREKYHALVVDRVKAIKEGKC